jgi:hypothetical protein
MRVSFGFGTLLAGLAGLTVSHLRCLMVSKTVAVCHPWASTLLHRYLPPSLHPTLECRQPLVAPVDGDHPRGVCVRHKI